MKFTPVTWINGLEAAPQALWSTSGCGDGASGDKGPVGWSASQNCSALRCLPRHRTPARLQERVFERFDVAGILDREGATQPTRTASGDGSVDRTGRVL